ncbi:ABC transporter permease [Cohaesibacter gelatinilyticus]|uniref:Amino acid ABC transporter membrane protein 2, PAAT family n=1 Tax=Cohaesibacter gelatinilyticus TaxID=372072 RepID=A0A285PFU0_9HYPH|nr:ABC transporter permease [Cohaesibacter gelatinilyticus]SNZ20564.1 amino acid ABC transporter membrane protein 2, PAAT family [Cohaesibacter gelatinilyticus]HAT87948.1 ABC transporter permease [Hyphomicrobiales bacterium]
MNWSLLFSFFADLAEGIPVTLAILASALSIGFVLGLLLCIVRLRRISIVSKLADFYVLFFRGTPLLVQLFAIYYGLGEFEFIRNSFAWPFLREAWFCAVLALGLNSAAFTSEIMRGGVLGVEKGQLEAAAAYGFSNFQTGRLILMPQAARIALPAYSNEIILMLKGTSLASTISIMDLTGIARKLSSEHFAPFEAFIAAGAIYLAMVLLLTAAFSTLEKRYA